MPGLVDKPDQQVAEAAHAVLPEHIDHDAHFLPLSILLWPAQKDHVPDSATFSWSCWDC